MATFTPRVGFWYRYDRVQSAVNNWFIHLFYRIMQLKERK
jgi:hypothetical protein